MKDIIRGIIIGIGKIIPGVSGSLIAISLGIYEEAIGCITNFFSDIRSNMYYLSKLGIGIIISISIFSGIIVFCLDKYYIITMLLFIGMIIGSTKFNNNYTNSKYISLITFSMVLALGLINKVNNIPFNNLILLFFYLMLIGLIDAATMVIPGISGTAILMILGAYNLVIKTYSSLFNLKYFYHNILVIIPLGLGLITGIYLTSKLVNYCFSKYYNQSYSAIKGLQWGTIIYMIILCLKKYFSISELTIGILFCILGMIFIKKINHFL